MDQKKFGMYYQIHFVIFIIKKRDPISLSLVLGGLTPEEMSSCEKLNPFGMASSMAIIVGLNSGCDIESHINLAKTYPNGNQTCFYF